MNISLSVIGELISGFFMIFGGLNFYTKLSSIIAMDALKSTLRYYDSSVMKENWINSILWYLFAYASYKAFIWFHNGAKGSLIAEKNDSVSITK